MRYRDTESGKIYDEIELLAEYLENAAEIEESSGARNFAEYMRNATSKNGFFGGSKGMKNLYTVSSTQKLIDDYLSAGGEIFQIREGVLGLGDFVLYDMGGKLKTYIVHEIALNEWSSGQSIRAYNKMPEKYRAMIERG